MTDEPMVEIESDTGRDKQWPMNLLFNKEGKKWTLAQKHLTYLLGAVFFITSLFLIFQGTPEVKSSKSENGITSAGGLLSDQTSQGTIDIPKSQADPTATRQSSKSNGPRVVRYAGPQLSLRPRTSIKVPPGSMIKAILLSGASDGTVKAKALEALHINGEVRVEEGTEFFGKGQSAEHGRLNVQFGQMIFKDGSTESIQGHAHDFEDKMGGIRGETLGRNFMQLVTGVGLNFIGHASQGLQEVEVEGGVPIRKSTIKNAFLHGGAEAAIDQAKEVLGDMKQRHKRVEVKERTEFYVMFGG